MYNITDFIEWALTHAKGATIPSGATLALPVDECGILAAQKLTNFRLQELENA